MTSIKFTDAKKVRILMHSINVFAVSFSFMFLLNYLGPTFGIDVNKPLKEYDSFTVVAGIASIIIGLVFLYGISFKLLSLLFRMLKI